MKSLAPLLLSLAIFTTGRIARADEAADKAQLTEIEHRSGAALVNGDFPALASIFAVDWKVVGPDGQILTRQQVFEQLRGSDLKFTSYDMTDLDIHVFGDTAIVIGHGNPRGESHGDKFELKEVFSDTFTRVGGEWRCILSHSSEKQ